MEDKKIIDILETELEVQRKKLKRSIPYSYFELSLVEDLGMTQGEIKKWMNENKDLPVVENLEDLIKSSFYQYSLKNKIAKGIEMYITHEMPKADLFKDFKVIVDINQYQKQLEPFDMNIEKPKEFKHIINSRDEIMAIPDKLPEGIEFENEGEND